MLLDIFIITNHQNESNLTDFQQRSHLSLDQKVLLGGKDSLFSLVVSKFTRAEVSWSSSLSKENSSLSSSVSIESRSGQLLDSCLSCSMGLSSWAAMTSWAPGTSGTSRKPLTASQYG